ncbi:MAG: DUF4908 domain-containing protein [Caulobacteraceae bacterium]|nr:DUF4908 domain-containing protein [Caulobacteraceae bacterium]
MVMRRLGPSGLLAVLGLTAGLVASPAAARSISLRDLLGGGPPTEQIQQTEPPVAVYTFDNGDRFVFDRSVSPPLMRFEASPEIWVLQPRPGPGGDVIYRNDLGEPMLRATRLGGLTLFTVSRPEGTAAALQGEASPLRPAAILSVLALQQRLVQASLRASRALQRLVVFEAPDVTPESATLIADTGEVSSEAIVDLARRADLRRLLDKLEKVVLSPARSPGASFKSGVLEVDFAPGQGLAGRPSSRRIERVVAR